MSRLVLVFPLGCASLAPLAQADRLLERRADREPGVERRERILENHLHLVAYVAQRHPACVRDVTTVEHDPSGHGRYDLNDRARER